MLGITCPFSSGIQLLTFYILSVFLILMQLQSWAVIGLQEAGYLPTHEAIVQTPQRGVTFGDYIGDWYRASEGDTRSLDYGSHEAAMRISECVPSCGCLTQVNILMLRPLFGSP